MSDGKIRVKSETIYSIEVNDKGECIYLDLSDIGLQAKLVECFDTINKETERFTKKEQELIKKINKEHETETTELYTKAEREYIKEQEEFYKTCRIVMDKFLGEGACQKIFGDANYPKMYIDLFEQLESEFKKMGLNKQKMEQDLYNKYIKKHSNILK